jgi:hypothetical protein
VFELVIALVFGILTPTAVLIALLTCTALLVSKVRGHAFSWPHHITMFFAACRLRLAFLLIGTPIVGVTLGRALYFDFVIIQTVRGEDKSPNQTKENRI